MCIGIIENNVDCIPQDADYSFLIKGGMSHAEVGVAVMQDGAEVVSGMLIHMWYDCRMTEQDHNYEDGRVIRVLRSEGLEALQPGNQRMAAAMRALGYMGIFYEVHASEKACPMAMKQLVDNLHGL